MPSADWQEHIYSDWEVMFGKPVVKGTRLSAEFILGLFSQGWTERQVVENYPSLTPEGIRAVFAYAAVHVREAPRRETHSCLC